LDDEILLVKKVEAEIIHRRIRNGRYNDIVIVDTRIKCILEDNRVFYLEKVPPEIVYSLKRIDGVDLGDDRERFIDVLLSIPEVIEIIAKHLKSVVIDEFDEETGVYSASVEFSDGNIVIVRKMIPSHAIFLAKLAGKPIYVKKKLVDQQESIYELLREIDDLDELSQDDVDEE